MSSFRSNHSLDLFLLFLDDSIFKGFGNGMYTGTILFDPQKAFGTTNHKIQLKKLLPISFSKNTISWYESYSAEVHFTVEAANQVPNFANISCGVLQGWVIGFLMFLIYDMSQAVESDQCLYAGYSCLLLQDKEVTKIMIILK